MPNSLTELSNSQLMRYSRHIMLPSVDIDGQTALWQARVLVIGIGGLGCSAAQYLVASGVGEVTLVDDDSVEIHNLQRQILHFEQHIGLSKTDSAKRVLGQINSEVQINTINHRLDGEELNQLVSEHDIVLDCTDNLLSRDQLNRACFTTKTPLVSGAAIRFEGQVSVFTMNANTPCYECLSMLFSEPAASCSESGVLSPIVGIVGSIQATETIKVLAGIGTPLTGQLLLIDGMAMSFTSMKIPVSESCKTCQGIGQL